MHNRSSKHRVFSALSVTALAVLLGGCGGSSSVSPEELEKDAAASIKKEVGTAFKVDCKKALELKERATTMCKATAKGEDVVYDVIARARPDDDKQVKYVLASQLPLQDVTLSLEQTYAKNPGGTATCDKKRVSLYEGNVVRCEVSGKGPTEEFVITVGADNDPSSLDIKPAK